MEEPKKNHPKRFHSKSMPARTRLALRVAFVWHCEKFLADFQQSNAVRWAPPEALPAIKGAEWRLRRRAGRARMRLKAEERRLAAEGHDVDGLWQELNEGDDRAVRLREIHTHSWNVP